MTNTFDAKQYVEELEAAGVSKQQASIHARTLAKALKNLVCHVDLDRAVEMLRRDMQQVEERLTLKIEMLRTELKAEMESIWAELRGFRTELLIHRWALGGLFAMSSANLALTMRIAFP